MDLRNGLALAFLAASLLVFVAFHFLYLPDSETPGWGIWIEVWRTLRWAGSSSNPKSLIAVASFVTFASLVVVSPFLILIFRKSRLALWLARILATVATLGFFSVVLANRGVRDMEPVMLSLLATPALNLLGLLLVRRDVTDAGSPEGFPGSEAIDR